MHSVPHAADIIQDQTCELLKWLCNYRKLHNTTKQNSSGKIPSCSWPNHLCALHSQ